VAGFCVLSIYSVFVVLFMTNLNRDDVIVDKILPIMLKEESRGLLTFFNELFDEYFPEKSEEEVNYYFQEMVAIGLIMPWRGSEYKAELAPFGREVINRGGWLRYLADEEKRRKKEEQEKEEDRELDRRGANAAERSATATKRAFMMSAIMAVLTVVSIGISAKKIKEVEVLEIKMSEQQGEIERLKGMRKDLDSLKTVVGSMGEIEQIQKGMPIKR